MGNLLRLIDPEILIPSSQSKESPEFWLRFMNWADERELKIGPSTYEALLEVGATLPQLPELSSNDFWPIISKLSGRISILRAGASSFCAAHLEESYSSNLGDEQNVSRLISDLSVSANDVRVTIETDSTWRLSVDPSCAHCSTSRVSVVDHSNETWRTDWLGSERLAFLESNDDVASVADSSEKLFPDLIFSDTAWDSCRKLDGDRREVLALLIHHLAVLNDVVPDVWSRLTQSNERKDALRLVGVDASIESVRTRSSERYMKYRDFRFGERTLRCEWHTKLYWNKNRIHFSIVDGRVHVGTITDHLPLPG